MPEGPEIRRAADRIERVIGGQPAREVFFAFERLRSFGDELRGRTVTRLETRGKALLTWFDDEVAVYSHNQLYGRWYVRTKGGAPQTRRQLRFAIHTDQGSALLYSASDIAVLRRDALESHPFLAKLGPDPLHSATTAARIRKQLKAFRRRRLGALLLDQAFVAGLGNYLRSEILFVARVDPAVCPGALEDERLAVLARTINTLTRRAYRTGGITSDAARVKALKRGGHPRREYRHYVFGRAGKACPSCSATIRREVIAGRRLYYCPGCQRE